MQCLGSAHTTTSIKQTPQFTLVNVYLIVFHLTLVNIFINRHRPSELNMKSVLVKPHTEKGGLPRKVQPT